MNDLDFGDLRREWRDTSTAAKIALGLGVAGIGVGSFLARRVIIGNPSEYIVKTGLGIADLSVSKQTIRWPFQTATRINVEPRTFSVDVSAMSRERIPFNMPSVWTVGPSLEMKSLADYARLLSEKGPDGIENLVQGVIQGETRVRTANMPLDDIFAERESFKGSVTERIDEVVAKFGLRILNANIAELSDLDENNSFFAEQKKRALQRVEQEAEIHIAEANKDGDIGKKIHQSESRSRVAELEMNAILAENTRSKEMAESNAALAVARATYERQRAIAEAEAAAAAEQRTAELQAQVEIQRAQQSLERDRAKDLSAATVAAEVATKEAEGRAAALRTTADAKLYLAQREAEGTRLRMEAQADGLKQLTLAAGGSDNLSKYLMIDRGVLQELADKQAKAVQGLKPNISVWNTGGAGPNADTPSASAAMTDLFRTAMPLLDGIKKQTGYDFLDSVGVGKHKKHGDKSTGIDAAVPTTPPSIP